ncbi:MAG: YfcE family phosphodiesterase [Solobacterium sp.]|nr:YfcE family phosphodiesterase [Solobacterium sp.]
MEEEILIILAGDNHRRCEPMTDLLKMYPDAALFLHIGDSEQSAAELAGWICAAGNNDYDPGFPLEQVIQAGAHRILLVHGDRLIYRGGYTALAAAGMEHGCDIVCFGHTHRYADKTVSGIRLLNPGSLSYNRDGSGTGYMEIRIHGNDIRATRKYM